MSKVTRLPASLTMTVEQALLHMLDLARTDNPKDKFTQIMISAYDAEGCLTVYSSRMTKGEALWMVESVKRHILED